MDHCRRRYLTRSAYETGDLARRIGAGLEPGHVLLLEGPVGAGKTHFARALIQSLLAVAEIWHADLYRLTAPDEVVELGLEEAFDTAICLVEWPDRLGDLVPDDALTLAFTVSGTDTRRIDATGPAAWDPLLPEDMTGAFHA